jgi:TctA family transporter
MAIFIGIFLILGFEPGPNMISEHLDIVLFMALTIAGSSLMASLIGLLIAPYIARASYVRPQVIVPTLIAISFLGGFLDSRVFMAVTITLVAGLCGFWFNLLNYSNAGIILGFLMGPLVERYLFLSLQAYGGQFFLRPISLAILMAGLAVIFVPYFGRRAEGKVLPPEGENQ